MTWTRERVIALCVSMFGLGSGAGYVAAPEEPLPKLLWCCDGDNGCHVVALMGDCPEQMQLFYCEWGQSTEASGASGESGWECLE